jgi:glutathione S-transferase
MTASETVMIMVIAARDEHAEKCKRQSQRSLTKNWVQHIDISPLSIVFVCVHGAQRSNDTPVRVFLDETGRAALKFLNSKIAMTHMTLFSGPLSMFGAKVHIAALEKGLPLDVVMVPFTMDHRYEPKHPEVSRVNPKRQVPVLIHADVELFDSTQIIEYFEHLQPQPSRWPLQPAARARARLLELKSDEVFFPHVIRLMGLQERLRDAAAQEAIAQAVRYYQVMDAMLAGGDFLSGEYTYADIAFYMAQTFAARLGAPMTAATPRLLAWRERLTARPAVLQVVRGFAASLLRYQLPIPDFIAQAAES